MRILIRTSRWAIWSRRLGSVAIPLVIIGVLLHRQGTITSDMFITTALLAALAAIGAVLSAGVALGRLWHTGDQGWSKALSGLFFGLICLLPFAWYGNLAMRYPPVTDIATTSRTQLPLVFEPATRDMPPPRMLSPDQIEAIFPNAQRRAYPLAPAQTFALAERLVADNGWTVRLLRTPGGTASPGQINARLMALPGWREEVVIQVSGDLLSSQVDMRSVSLNAPHDFGSNGRRLERFLADLDSAVTVLLRDNPDINRPEPEPVSEPMPTPPPAS